MDLSGDSFYPNQLTIINLYGVLYSLSTSLLREGEMYSESTLNNQAVATRRAQRYEIHRKVVST